MSEYVAKCDERIEFLSGFSGSNGICLVTQEDEADAAKELALMWTDGRYFLQAGKQLYEGWTMMKMGAGEPHYAKWIQDNLKKGSKIGCDETQIPQKVFEMRAAGLKAADIELIPGKNLVDEVWENRPQMPQEAVWVLEDKYAGESVQSKYERIAAKWDGADLMVLTTLDDIAWVLNLRGNDISFNPLFFSYVIIHNKTADASYKVDLFIAKAKVAAADVSKHLADNNVTVHEYDQLLEKIKEYGGSLPGKKVVIDASNCNYQVNKALTDSGFEVIDKANICEALKAEKNKVQMDGMRSSNVRDCAAIMKYFAFLEEELKKDDHGLNEYNGSEKLLEFRRMGELFKQPSFGTISSIGPNGAVIHYSPTEDENSKLNNDEIYLLDSGGQYLDGTTDITRTTHFGG